MAKKAGLNVPAARLFKSKKKRGYFGVKRFDHDGVNRFHMHTVGGLLHIDHRIPSFDYETLIKATMLLTKDMRECEKQFRHAVFNVLAHNRDDHVKNFSFVMDAQGDWRVSPAYDLTFSMGPGGEHCTTIMREGKHPNISHLLQLAKISGIEKSHALIVIDQVRAAVSQWNQFAEMANVTKKSSALIQSRLNRAGRS
jgi:serine/threonine-protein kinase HipA